MLHEPRIEVTRLVAEDPEAEAARLERAIAGLRASIDEMLLLPEVADGEQREVLEAYRMFAHDAGWLRRMREAIGTGLSAEAAVRRVQEETRVRMAHVTDPYLQRAAARPRRRSPTGCCVHLTGRALHATTRRRCPSEFILVARNLGPAELLEYDRARLRGVVLEEGSPDRARHDRRARARTSRWSAGSRAAMAAIDPGDPVALDGDNGQIFVRPSDEVAAGVRARDRGARRAAPRLRRAARRCRR